MICTTGATSITCGHDLTVIPTSFLFASPRNKMVHHLRDKHFSDQGGSSSIPSPISPPWREKRLAEKTWHQPSLCSCGQLTGGSFIQTSDHSPFLVYRSQGGPWLIFFDLSARKLGIEDFAWNCTQGKSRGPTIVMMIFPCSSMNKIFKILYIQVTRSYLHLHPLFHIWRLKFALRDLNAQKIICHGIASG